MTAALKTVAPQGKAGDWEGIIDILILEHGHLLSLLEALEKETQQLERGQVPDFMLLRDMIDYLMLFPGEYHHPREELIYEDLRRTEPSFAPVYERLEREHQLLHQLNNSLFQQITHICEGRPADRKKLFRQLLNYIEVYRKHIRFETKDVFPQARTKLSAAQLKHIEARTRYRNDPFLVQESSGSTAGCEG